MQPEGPHPVESRRRIGLIGLALSILIAPGCFEENLLREPRSVSVPEPERGGEFVNIEALPAGTILTDPVFGTGGSGPIQITGVNPGLPGQNAAVVFDSANPTGGDFDLGTPNEDFGGPGVGEGGDTGSPFANMVALGKLIIVDVSLADAGGDGLVDDPNDADVVGAAIDFNFSALGTVTINEITIVDVEAIEEAAFVDLYGPGDVLIDTFVLPQVGDNGVATVPLGPTAGVERVHVTLNGSAAIDNLFFVPPTPGLGSIGDFVWCDENNDGVQDPTEPPLSNVTVRLFDCDGNLLSTTTTDSNGLYLFSDLEAGCYEVVVDPTTAPEDCSVPGEHCPTEITVDLDPEENFLDADFCFGPEPEGGEGCTPGYWKNHVDSWVGYSPDQTVESVFANAALYPSISGATLLEALKFGGGPGSLGAAQLLVHHGVAALLNASHPGVDYPRTAADIESDVDAALLTQDRDTMLDLKSELDRDNNLGCPLN